MEMLPMRDGRTTTNDEQGKIELLSKWMLDAEFRNLVMLRNWNGNENQNKDKFKILLNRLITKITKKSCTKF